MRKGGEIIIATLILLIAIGGSTLLVLASFSLVFWARLMASRTSTASLSDRSLHATVILREIRSLAHQKLQDDPNYRKSLFDRYAPLLKKDMDAVLKVGGFDLRLYFWSACFRLYYSLLSMQSVPRLLGLEPDGLRILLATVLPAAKSFRTAN